MIAALRFDAAGNPRFEPATNVRLSAVCAVANTVTEHLSRLLDRELNIDVFEPVIVPIGSQPALFANARVFLAHCRSSDLLLVFRERDARRLAACAFREGAENLESRELSEVEEQVIERIGRELAPVCAPLCGEMMSFAPAHGPIERYECATYFELRLGSPVDAVIGLGLSRDPAPPSDRKLAHSALLPVWVDVTGRLARTRVPARRMMALSVGSVLRFDTALDEPASLLVGDVEIARGECGLHRGVMAFSVTSNPTEESVKPA
ncbi:MAG: FliM/FliN family flagellar motor C-terminal domain-containing protein [Vulcanimicrobiaceae bacterium]